MKKFCLLLIILLVNPLSATESSRTQLNRETQRLAAQLLLNNWRQTFAAHSFPAGTQAIYQMMSAQPGANVEIAVAYRNAQKEFNRQLNQTYEQQARRVLQPFAGQLSPTEFNRGITAPEQWLHQRSELLFPNSFKQARSQLTREQRQKLFKKIYPSEKELETLTDQQLNARLTQRFCAQLTEPLFAENRQLLRRELIAPAIASGRQQQQLQLQLLRHLTAPRQLWDKTQIKQYLTQELQLELSRRVSSGKLYNLFALTQQKLTKQADNIPLRRTLDALPDHLVSTYYPDQLRSNPSTHRTWAASWAQIVPEVTKFMVETAVRDSGLPPNLQPEVVNSPRFNAALQRHLQQQIIPELKRCRQQQAAQWIQKQFPDLTAQKWRPAPELVEQFALNNNFFVPFPLVSPAAQLTMLEEVKPQIIQLQRQALQRTAQELRHQRQVVDQVYDDVLNFPQEQYSNSGNSWWKKLFKWGQDFPEVSDIVHHYRTTVLQHLPEKSELFPCIEKEITIRAQAICQQLQTRAHTQTRLPVRYVTIFLSESRNQICCRLGRQQFQTSQAQFEQKIPDLIQNLSRHLTSDLRRKTVIQLKISGTNLRYCQVAKFRDALAKQLGGNCEVQDSYWHRP